MAKLVIAMMKPKMDGMDETTPGVPDKSKLKAEIFASISEAIDACWAEAESESKSKPEGSEDTEDSEA